MEPCIRPYLGYSITFSRLRLYQEYSISGDRKSYKRPLSIVLYTFNKDSQHLLAGEEARCCLLHIYSSIYVDKYGALRYKCNLKWWYFGCNITSKILTRFITYEFEQRRTNHNWSEFASLMYIGKCFVKRSDSLLQYLRKSVLILVLKFCNHFVMPNHSTFSPRYKLVLILEKEDGIEGLSPCISLRSLIIICILLRYHWL